MVFISNFCHMLLNLNLLLSLSCSVTVSVTYVGLATGWGEGEKSRPAGGPAAPAGRASARRRGWITLWGVLPPQHPPAPIKAVG